ncbi:hypothetical protein QTL97_10985 [Sporosarcina thermotolerans]|uniref:Uncharacterized protein n=1 Tax=Sporosarcina thermotolerans TaxID=633404 RepID=A0AAW9AE99_9BACL|nr:hypothetical protein [Sporosarcina thermotolerans]MDW0117461.1 hypothetical protein [Sporosarcina thermotolerans]WHT49638.1 hypothetical protein QNH10_09120 [Sporosarcina thermotolerans]
MKETEAPTLSHKQVAATCFNQVWDLLEKEVRTPEEKEQMIHLCHSSFWHWTQAEECTETNLSIGYWQLSRVYAVVGQGENALNYAKRCIAVSEEASLAPFYIGYGYEAAARACNVLGRNEESQSYKDLAYECAEKMIDEDSKKLLVSDLESLK